MSVDTVLILTHGAGGDKNSALLRALDTAIVDATGITVERVNLEFREQKKAGAPGPAAQARDREGLRAHVERWRTQGAKRVFLGGQSYGGRMSSMLVAESPGLVDGLFLTSYPLHPPGRPDKPRTEHLSAIKTPVLFIHGDRDPFGTHDEIRAALELIPARKRLFEVAKAGHDLNSAKGEIAARVAAAFKEFFLS